MKKNSLFIVSIVGIIAISGIAIYAISKNDDGMMDNMFGMHHGSMSGNKSVTSVDKNSAEYKMYSQLKGEDYDRAFLSNMIQHHQGAVDIAKLALVNAKHQKIKDLANAIISTQTSEIASLQSWQNSWSYRATGGSMMEDHSSMGMMDDMSGMTDDLKNFSGDDFDKNFLSSMIEHHQSAINMAAPGEANAQHQEVKTLAKTIVAAQTKEIEQMKQWQKEWNY